VLIVNDELMMLKILTTTFENYCQISAKNITTATNGAEAYELAVS